MADDTQGERRAQAEREAALAYLKRVWPEDRQVCPVCGETDWGISDVANLPVRRYPSGALWLDDATERAYPLVPINCVNCGYTFFINERWVRGDTGTQ